MIQYSYYTLILGKIPPQKVFSELKVLLASLSIPDKIKLANQVPALLLKYPILPENSLMYFDLIEEIFNLLDLQHKLLICYYAFNTTPLYGEPKWKDVILRLLDFSSENFGSIPEECFFSQDFLIAMIRQGCFIFSSFIILNKEFERGSKEDMAAVHSLAKIFNSRGITSFPTDILNTNSDIETWLSYLSLIIELKEIVNNEEVIEYLNSTLVKELNNFMKNIIPLNIGKYSVDSKLVSYTDFITMKAVKNKPEEIKASILKQYKTYFKTKEPLIEASSISFPESGVSKQISIEVLDSSNEDIEILVEELKSHEEVSKVHELESEISGISSLDISSPCDYGVPIECKIGRVKSLAQVDRKFICNECTVFVYDYVKERDKAMKFSSNSFHSHFKHQYGFSKI